MIIGVVKSDEACIRLKVKGSRREQEVEAVIDTGCTASLTLPSSLTAALGLKWQSVDRGTLADGSECLVDVYEANVEWDGKPRRVLVDGKRPPQPFLTTGLC
jgi:predicted aspartyl protease